MDKEELIQWMLDSGNGTKTEKSLPKILGEIGEFILEVKKDNASLDRHFGWIEVDGQMLQLQIKLEVKAEKWW